MGFILTVILFVIAVVIGFIAIKALRRRITVTATSLASSISSLSLTIESLAARLDQVVQHYEDTNNYLRTLHAVLATVQPPGAYKLTYTANAPLDLDQLNRPESAPVLVNIGCGSTYDRNWINLDINPVNSDIICVDASQGLPFQPETVDALYASHVLEHLQPHEAPRFIRDIHRVLKPGGILRIVVPDLEQISTEYLNSLQAARTGTSIDALRHQWMLIELIDQVARQTNDGGEMLRFLLRHGEVGLAIASQRLGEEIAKTTLPWDSSKTKADWIREISQQDAFSDEEIYSRRNKMSLWDTALFRKSGEPHLWMYDDLSLTNLLAENGFASIRKMTASTSSIANFNSYGLDITDAGLPRKPDSLFMEAVKPA